MASRGTRAGQWLIARLPRILAATAAGLLMCASFPPTAWAWAAIAAIAVLGVVLTRPATSRAGGFGYGLIFGLAFYLPLLPWISGLVGPMPWVMLAVLCALFPALFGWLAVGVRAAPGWPLWFAVLWAAQEWLKCTVPFGGFPWGVVGFSQSNSPLLVLVRLGGVPLLSTAVALIGFSVSAFVVELWTWWRREHGTSGHTAPPAVAAPGAFIAALLLVTALVYPQVRHAGAGSPDDPVFTVAVVQGNVPRLGLDFNAQRRAVLDNHVGETLRLAEAVRAGAVAQPQLVVWPENSSDIDPLANPDARDRIDAAARAVNAPILVGGVVSTPEWTPARPSATNSVIVWDPRSGPGERHDKKIVQPFGEYLPWRGFFRHLSSYADRAGYFLPGSGDGVVHAGGVPVGVTTCWEVIFDRAAREAVTAGAQLLAVPTNNATFDQGMSEQQLAFARVRAVEHNRYVVVAGTTGISAIIAPDGREMARTAFFQPAFLDAQIRLKTALTPATRWAQWVQYLLVGIGFVVAVVGMRQNRSFMRQARRRRQQPMIDNTGPTDDQQGAP